MAYDTTFGRTSKSVSHDHAGNLMDDGSFRYVYDAWNRLIKVQKSADSGAVVVQAAESLALVDSDRSPWHLLNFDACR